MKGVPTILGFDHRVEATFTNDIGLIRENTNPIVLYKEQISTFCSASHFKGTSMSAEHIDRMTLDGNVDIGSQ